MGRFSQFLSMDSGAESMSNVGSEFENNLEIIQQCRIGNIFTESAKAPYRRGAKGRLAPLLKRKRPSDSCWDLVFVITSANLHQFSTYWPQFHECLGIVSQFPLFSPCPFAEKAIIALFKIAVRILSASTARFDKTPEDLTFKTINVTWKLDKDILGTMNNSNASISSTDKNQKAVPSNISCQGNLAANLFMKLAEALRKTSLVQREEIGNQAVHTLVACFAAAEDLEFTPGELPCMLQPGYLRNGGRSPREDAGVLEEGELAAGDVEVTLKEAIELLVDIYPQFMVPLWQSPGFRSFWLGVLRRMDTCMKANVDDIGTGALQEAVPGLLKKMLVQMKEKEILVQRDEDELWDIINIQIQWIAPSVKEELFPDEF